jgi:hypothetical protein
MTVPETTVDENGGSISGEEDVGSARQRAVVQTKPQTGSVQILTDGKFGCGILAPDSFH